MTVFSGYREHMEPVGKDSLHTRLEQTGVLVRMPRRRRSVLPMMEAVAGAVIMVTLIAWLVTGG